MEFVVRYSPFYRRFSVIDFFMLFGMDVFCKNVLLVSKFLKTPFLLSPLVFSLSVLISIGPLIYGNSIDWLLNLNAI